MTVQIMQNLETTNMWHTLTEQFVMNIYEWKDYFILSHNNPTYSCITVMMIIVKNRKLTSYDESPLLLIINSWSRVYEITVICSRGITCLAILELTSQKWRGGISKLTRNKQRYNDLRNNSRNYVFDQNGRSSRKSNDYYSYMLQWMISKLPESDEKMNPLYYVIICMNQTKELLSRRTVVDIKKIQWSERTLWEI